MNTNFEIDVAAAEAAFMRSRAARRICAIAQTTPLRQDCNGARCPGRCTCESHHLALAGRHMGDYSAPSLSAEGRCPNRIAAAVALAA